MAAATSWVCEGCGDEYQSPVLVTQVWCKTCEDPRRNHRGNRPMVKRDGRSAPAVPKK